AADELRIDLPRDLDLAAGSLLDLIHEPVRVLVRELQGRRQLDVQPALLGSHQAIELSRDVFDAGNPALLRRQAQEVPNQLVGAAHQSVEKIGLRGGIELGVSQDAPQLRDVSHCRGEVAQLSVDLLQPSLLLCSVEERLRVPAVDGGYLTPPSPGPRSRGRGSPRRSGACGLRPREPCRSPSSWRSASTRRLPCGSAPTRAEFRPRSAASSPRGGARERLPSPP